jgi:hypothetical protein
MNQIQPARDVLSDLVDGYYDALDRLKSLSPES